MGKQIAWVALAAGMLAAAHFAVWPARTYRTWWVALIATELGHVWFFFALTLAAVAARGAWSDGAGAAARALALVAAVAAGLAAAGFARPVWDAARLSGKTQKELFAVFGDKGVGESCEPLWSWGRLWRWPTKVEIGAVETSAVGSLKMDFYPAGKLMDGEVCHQIGDKASGPEASAGTKQGTGGAPCVILVHGGGWDGGDRTELAGFNHWLAARGVAVVAFDYRLAPAFPWPAQRADLRGVVTWVRANAERLGIDPERITLVGRSAGAQIATATAYGEKLPGVRAVVALYGVHNLEFVWSIRSEHDSLNSDKLMKQYLGGPPEGAIETYKSGSAEMLAHADVPPTLIIHGALDELVWCRHSEKLSAALTRAGAPHVFVRLPWATHAGEANLHGPSGQLITGAVLRVAHGM